MKIGLQLNLSGGPIEEFVRLVEWADHEGFDPILISDGMSLSGVKRRDPYVLLGLCARRTSHARLGTCVTNPLTRHPMITAQAMCTVDEASEGRAVLGIGSGDTPIYTMGYKKASIQQMRDSLSSIKAFFSGVPFQLGGGTVRSIWGSRQIPVWLAASGPETLALAGELADGAIVDAGLTPMVYSWAIQQVHKGASMAKREVDDLAIWLNAISHIDEDRERARTEIRERLVTRINHNFRMGIHAVPEQHMPEVERWRAEYDESDYGPGSKNIALVTDYMVDRFSITGTADYCKERFLELAGMDIEGVIVATHWHPEPCMRFLKAFAQSVMPALV